MGIWNLLLVKRRYQNPYALRLRGNVANHRFNKEESLITNRNAFIPLMIDGVVDCTPWLIITCRAIV